MFRAAIAVCIALFAIVVVVTRSSPSETAAASSPDVDDESQHISAPIEPASPAPKPRKSPEPVAEPTPTPEPVASEYEMQAALMATEFADQGRGSAWANTAAPDITRALADESGIADLEVECRETLCRLDLSITDPTRGMAVIRDVAHKIPWHFDGFFEVSPDETTARLYVARQGTAIPTL